MYSVTAELEESTHFQSFQKLLSPPDNFFFSSLNLIGRLILSTKALDPVARKMW
jgi:hypothetical protein